MPKIVNISNQRFGNLVAIRKTNEKYHKNSVWECLCDCGNVKNISIHLLKTKHTTTCGHCNNKWIILENVCECVVKQKSGKDMKFMIDKEDYNKVKEYSWYIENNGYVRGKVNNKKVSLHRFILDVPENMVVDHINHNPLDNRRSELRICKITENMMNKVIYSNNKSGIKGVYYYKWSNKWVATIKFNRQKVHLGYFKTKEEAIETRKKAEEKYYGEYAYKEAN